MSQRTIPPVLLLLFSGRMFERLFYDSMFDSLTENSLIPQNQSGYKSSDSCTNQLIFIAHKVYKSFDGSQEVRKIRILFSN